MMDNPNLRLSGRVAIVTGASRGMGKAIAIAFAREGANVAVVARSESQWNEKLPGTIHETVAEITSFGGRAVAIPADLGNPDEVELAYQRSVEAFGSIDILVNNAAITVPGRPPKASDSGLNDSGASAMKSKPRGPFGSFVDFPISGVQRHMNVGFFAAYRLMQLVLPDMIAQRAGSIINISSIAGLLPGEGPYVAAGTPGPIAYGGNKAALHHLTQCVAQEMQIHSISVNVLSPSEPIITPGNLYAMAGNTDWASPEDFAEATIRVALMKADTTTGQLLWDADVLHPELGRRGWLR